VELCRRAVSCRYEFIDDVSARDAVLEDQVNAMETGRENAWSAAEMGARYPILANRIVRFGRTLCSVV